MKTAIIIPAYNEGERIGKVLKQLAKSDCDVIVVDDGSKDNTSKVAEKYDVTILRQIINLGKGCAARTGCDYAYEQGYDQMILMDADGQHDPKDIPRFLKELKEVDLVFGYRTGGKAPVVLQFGNWGLTWMTKVFFGLEIIDTQSGFRAFSRKAYRQIKWKSSGYGMESEMIYRAKGLKYTQIPIKKIYLDENKGTTAIHGVKIGLQMLKWKLFGG